MKSTAFTAIVIAFGEVESISAFMFRLRGERLLSLCGESKQRRTKEGGETLSGCFPSRLWNLPPLPPNRGTPPHGKRAVSHVFDCVR